MRLLLAPLVLLVGCASVPAPAPAPTPRLARLEYHIEFPRQPAGTGDHALSLRLPPEASARALEASLLVGNATLSLSLEQGAHDVRREFGELVWDAPARVLLARSHGRPLELVLRLAAPAGQPSAALERELALGTSAEADGRAVEGLYSRLRERP